MQSSHVQAMFMSQWEAMWQDWKYTPFVIFIRHSQNIESHSAMQVDTNLLRMSSKT